ncbi:MAG: DUF2336 domain-containing protein [Pseudomonadota bacterium]
MVIEYFLEWIKTASTIDRVEAARSLVRSCLDRNTEPEFLEEIEEALTLLLDDNAPVVRLEIAESFGAHARAPKHLIATLASDSSEIAMVVLSQSPVFHDAELIHYLQNGSRESQIAISCRPWLSKSIVTAICKTGCEEAIVGLLMNPITDFSSIDLHTIAERFGQSAETRNLLLECDLLSAETRHLLIGKLGQSLSSIVVSKGWLSKTRAEKSTKEACDKASIIFAAHADCDDVSKIAHQLVGEERVTAKFLLRAICMGNISLVASSFSVLSGVKVSRVEAILLKNRYSAFKALYYRAGLPKSAFEIFHKAVTIWQRLLNSGSKINQARLPFMVTKEVLEMVAAGGHAIDDELIVLLRQISSETARQSAIMKVEEITTSEMALEKLEIQSKSEVFDIQDAEIIDNEISLDLIMAEINAIEGNQTLSPDEALIIDNFIDHYVNETLQPNARVSQQEPIPRAA